MRHLKNLRFILFLLCLVGAYYFHTFQRMYSLCILAIGFLLLPQPSGKKGWFLRILLSLACFAFAIYIYLGYYPNSIIQHQYGDLNVYYLDVGQGESTFIELPNGETILIDAGTYEQGPNVTSFIKKLGYTNIDYVIVTHSHADHIGGMSQVLDNFRINNIYISNPPDELNPDSYSYHHFLDLVKKYNLNLQYGYAGMDVIKNDQVQFRIISPQENFESEDLNQYSLMTRLEYGNTAFVFTGDAGYPAEFAITEGDISANVLQIGHHGGSFATSSQFLKQISPDIAIISVGKDNENNLPNVNTITSIENEGIRIIRTDESETILITSNGYNLTSLQEHFIINNQNAINLENALNLGSN